MNDKSDIIELIRRHMLRFEADALVDSILLLSRNGMLPPGTRLPRISDMAVSLGLSTSTISRAWSNLVQMGVIETRRRGGTIIATPVEATAYRMRGVPQTSFEYHLAPAYPDPTLQADLRPLLRRVAEEGTFGGYFTKDEISASLLDAIVERVGYGPDRVLLDTEIIGALPRVLHAVSHRGAAIGIGNPDFPLYQSIIKQAGMSSVPIHFDDDGYSLKEIDAALSGGLRVLLLQTRVQNPTGLLVPTVNLASIAQLLRKYDATAIEIDHHGMLAPEANKRLASFAPDRVILLTAFSKEIHPDIRVSAITGPRAIMDRISVWRTGGEWVSAINTKLLEIALSDSDVIQTVARAREEYARRREFFVRRFESRGIRIKSNAGLCLWVPVTSEQETLLHLASQGISVARGSAYFSGDRSDRTDHIFLSLGGVGSHSDDLSARVLEASFALPEDLGFLV